MDSVSHVRVAHLLLNYVEHTCGVTFDQSGFVFGNLKPDLKGEYFSKRHYPSVMYDEVMDKIRAFTEKYTLCKQNSRDISVDLGEICHYMTDFFCFPHNDDIYDHNLLAHYVYEKRIALCIRRRLSGDRFEQWASPIVPPVSLDGLLGRIGKMHEQYRTQTRKHCINDDLMHVCRVTAMVVLSIINITYQEADVAVAALA